MLKLIQRHVINMGYVGHQNKIKYKLDFCLQIWTFLLTSFVFHMISDKIRKGDKDALFQNYFNELKKNKKITSHTLTPTYTHIYIYIIFKTKINNKNDTIVCIFIYYQIMLMKRELVSQNVHKAHLFWSTIHLHMSIHGILYFDFILFKHTKWR